MKVVAFNGSARKDGNTAILIKQVFSVLEKEGIKTELVQLAGHNLKGCVGCWKCTVNKDKKCAETGDIVNDCIAKMIEADYLGEILRPTAEMLKMPACQDQLCSYHDLLKVAGRQLIEKEKIDDDVLKKLHEPWMSAEEFIKTLNEWSAKIKEETYEKNNA